MTHVYYKIICATISFTLNSKSNDYINGHKEKAPQIAQLTDAIGNVLVSVVYCFMEALSHKIRHMASLRVFLYSF